MCGSRVEYRERRPPGAVFLYHYVWTAIVLRSHVHAMPVNGGRFSDIIFYMHIDLLSMTQYDSRAEDIAVCSHGGRCLARFKLHASLLQVEVNVFSAERIRNMQGVLGLDSESKQVYEQGDMNVFVCHNSGVKNDNLK